MVVYRKGELSKGSIDRQWPHPVALPAARCGGANYVTIRFFCEERNCRFAHASLLPPRRYRHARLLLCSARARRAIQGETNPTIVLQFETNDGAAPYDTISLMELELTGTPA